MAVPAIAVPTATSSAEGVERSCDLFIRRSISSCSVCVAKVCVCDGLTRLGKAAHHGRTTSRQRMSSVKYPGLVDALTQELEARLEAPRRNRLTSLGENSRTGGQCIPSSVSQ